MKISVDISMYPLDSEFKTPIKQFIRRLRAHEGLEVLSNQMSTQVTGEFEAVTSALNASMREAMEEPRRVVFVTRYLNADLELARSPDID